MSHLVGLLGWSVLLFLLLRHDPDKRPTRSRALWLPVIWISIMASRLPSQWLGHTHTSAAVAFEEGSAIDRSILLALIVMAVVVLHNRRLDWAAILTHNFALVMLLSFAFASVIWSDFPYISFKRWIRDLGMYLMVIVVLSDAQPHEAVSIVIRRISYLLVIPSIVLIKYYPETGVFYDYYTGRPEYTGVGTSKNMLGAICVMSGLLCFWDTVRRWHERGVPHVKWTIALNIVLMAMTLWLLKLSESATSRACLALGCVTIAMFRTPWAKVNPRRVTVAIPVALALYIVADWMLDLSSIVAQLLGRDPTFTGRTGMWEVLLAAQTNPLLGVGYQSFWLGSRLAAVWNMLDVSFLNEAHNGYLETYLNLGLVGLGLLGLVMIASYRTVSQYTAASPHFASFGLALWAIMVLYNVTEAAFGASVLWTLFLLGVVVIPRSDVRVHSIATESVVRRTRGELQRQGHVRRI